MDEDSDGLADAWETAYWPEQDPNLHGPNDDPDGDGLRNKDEYYIHWDPTVSNSGSILGLIYNNRIDVNFPSVAMAVLRSVGNDTLVLEPGTLYERINFGGKPLCLRSIDPNNANVVAATIVDGNSTSLDTVTFNTGETASAMLDGLTIRGGHYGIYCNNSSSPTITKCVVRNNSSTGVFAVSSSSPAVSDCEIRQNGSYGISLDTSSAAISRCGILSNGNWGVNALSYVGTIQNCVIAKNSGYGIAFNNSPSAQIINCTVADHSNVGVSAPGIQIGNCIVWGNNDDLAGCSATYSCIEDQDTGTGNIHGHPMFVDSASDDYHLWYISPCINAGDPSSSYANEPNGGGGRIDLGAYGNTAEAATSVDEDADGLDDRWETAYWPGQDPNLHAPNEDPDGDGLRNKDEYYAHWNPTVNDSNSIIGLVRNSRVDVNYPSIFLAAVTAANGDTLTMAPGTFYERVNFNGKPVTLRSTDPNDPNVVAATIIDANGVGNGITCSLDEGAASVIDGLTVRHAQTASTYAGIKCVSASPAIRNCVLRDSYSGIYLDNSSSEITHCQGINNSYYGLTLSGSSAPVVSRGVFSNNGSYGVQCNNSGSTVVKNCVIASNANSGVYVGNGAHAAVTNCTFVGNTSRGLSAYNTSTDVDVNSCILWNNNDDLLNCSATFSCIEDSDTGRGNIHTNPLFHNAGNGDFHLDANSPCIDAGTPWFDYANEPSPNGGRIDMGAYGNTAEAPTSTDVDSDGISDIWEVAHWPGDDPNLHNPTDNPDGDRLTNWSEYLFGTNPVTAEPSETLQIHYAAPSASTFNPTQGQTVTIQYWVNIDANAVVSVVEDGNPSNVIWAISQSATVGRNQWVWDGRDANGLVVEHGFYDVAVDANDGIDTANYDCGTVELTYPHRVSDVRARPYRFIATNDEITTITYDLTVDANMVVSIYDPTGHLFRTLTVPQADPNEVVWDGRNKDVEEPDSWCISQDGTYGIEVRYEGMREKANGTVTAYK